jgi:hypothetical protein
VEARENKSTDLPSWGSLVEKNGDIKNEINERIRKATQVYYLTNSVLWEKDKERVKPQYAKCTLRRYYYMERRHGRALKDESKIQATEMKFLRAVMGKSKEDRIGSTHI